MSNEEDLIRSTTRAIASTVHEVPPLRLEPAADELGMAGRVLRRGAGGRAGGRAGGPGQHRWRTWAAPVTAAAVVIALAIALVLVKDLPNEGGVSAQRGTSTAGSTAGPDGAPRYYVALKVTPATLEVVPGQVTQLSENLPGSIVVGDSLTGKTLATFAPPARTTFQSVSAAADDRTFVVFAETTADKSGSFDPTLKGITLTGSWYKVQLAPGTAHPATLSKLPVRPWSWTAKKTTSFDIPSAGQIYATALSQSGQELAVADLPQGVPAADKPQNWQEVKVFSVSTGRLLHDWTSNDPGVQFDETVSWVNTSALTWIDGDKALAVATTIDPPGAEVGTVRRLNVAGPPSGNLMTDSTVIRSATLPWNQTGECFNTSNWPPLVSADGKTISCLPPAGSTGKVLLYTDSLATRLNVTLDYPGTIPPTGDGAVTLVYVSPSARTFIVEWVSGGFSSPAAKAYFGVVSHGKLIRLPIPASMAAPEMVDISF
jgi:hypothetical protein